MLKTILQSTFVGATTFMLLSQMASAATFTTEFFNQNGTEKIGELTFSGEAGENNVLERFELEGEMSWTWDPGYVDAGTQLSYNFSIDEVTEFTYDFLNKQRHMRILDMGPGGTLDFAFTWDSNPLRLINEEFATIFTPTRGIEFAYEGTPLSLPDEPPASTPEPSLILGFITVGGLMLGSRKKEKA